MALTPSDERESVPDIDWKRPSESEKREGERLGRLGSGWHRIDPNNFPDLVGGYREEADFAIALVEGTTVETGARSDCTVVTFIGNRQERRDRAVDQEAWVTAFHTTGMNSRVAEIQHPSHDSRSRRPGEAFWNDPNSDARQLDPLPNDRDHGPLPEIEGTVYESALDHVRPAAVSASSDW